ncbi:MAG TPA: TonB-dependent receptor plug domain-containing protein [Hyphomonadaceae bacterium]|nr:TonB-dependent receptor plug domain-containing protein [Hyphomonadaceae bacterium]HPN06896.1 TonB-dependent receptor plug domain-containing protein [Hyphomonadaceae bacterium]
MSTGNTCAHRAGGRAPLILTASALSIAASLYVASPAFAQEQAPPVTAQPANAATKAQAYEPSYFARFAPKTAVDMVKNIPGFTISDNDSDERGFGQAKQNVLINGRRVSGKSNDAETALGRISADSVVRIEIVDGATLNIPGLSGQVANVIAKVTAFSGTWNIEPQFRENLQPSWFRGGVSANGKTEDGWSWSAQLNAQEFHNGHDGPGTISSSAGNVLDARREGFHGEGHEPDLAATLTYEAQDGAIANMNFALRKLDFEGLEESYRNPVNATPYARFTNVGEEELGGELGADYEFDLGPGRLKLIGLHRYEEGDDLVTIESYNPAGVYLAGTGERVLEHEEEGESIVRAEYGFAAFGGDLHLAAEGAFNFLDLATGYGMRAGDGSYTLDPLPGGNARVEERRAETNVTYSRQLGDAWNLQGSLGVEYSELTQTGGGGLTREFVRPKGFLSLVWKVDPTLDVNMKVERKVGQLDFGDFLSSVDIQSNNQSAGNVDLVPEQSWIFSSEINKALGAWGAVKLAGEFHMIEDVVDLVPIDANGLPVRNPSQNIGAIVGGGVGNIDKAWAYSITGSGTLKLDQIGLKGVQIDVSYRYRDSELDDPLTGTPREISWAPQTTASASVRWDIPETTWALVAGIEEYRNYAGYRLDQVAWRWDAPSVNFFSIENKDVFGMKVRLQAVNLNDTSENYKRFVYQSAGAGQPRLRTNGVDFVEERYRTFGPMVRLRVSGTF